MNKLWFLVLKGFERSITKAQTESLLSEAFLSFLAFLQDNVDYHVTFENQLRKLKGHSDKTLFVYIGFSLRLLIHVVKGLWAYSSLSLTYIFFSTKELLQTSLVHQEKNYYVEND